MYKKNMKPNYIVVYLFEIIHTINFKQLRYYNVVMELLITTKVVRSNPADDKMYSIHDNIMWSSLSMIYDKSVVYSSYTGVINQ